MNIVRNEPGWLGGFTRNQAPGAIPNGSRVRKVRSEQNDPHPVGALATVLGSLGPAGAIVPDEELAAVNREITELNESLHQWGLGPDEFFYFVEWDADPRCAVGVRGIKIEPA
jgi:hypothetical protein